MFINYPIKISSKFPIKEPDTLEMLYNARRDFYWLIFSPWILIPRTITIFLSLINLGIKLIFFSLIKNKNCEELKAKELFRTLTKLGPCFIKTGQALSTRPDLLSKDWLNTLTKLQDSVPAFQHKDAIEIIEKEIGASVNRIFKYFPEKPIASASLGIVYKAILLNNKEVAVKVQRPNLDFVIRRDLVIIRLTAQIISPILPLNLGFGIAEIIDEFGKSLLNEIDYIKEADNAERFATLFSTNPSVEVPSVERIYSSKKVITTSWVNGVKISNKNEIERRGINPTLIIKTAVISGLQQLLEFGYFHADPHPGNMFAIYGSNGNLGKLAYVDFGMMDSISDQDRITLTGAIVHLINNDFYSLAEDFKKLGFLNQRENLKKISPILEKVLGGVLTKDVGSFNLKNITNKFSALMFNYPFRVPARFALIIRAVVSQEGLALKLDPNFKIIRFAYPYVARRLLVNQNDEMIEILIDIIFDKDNMLNIDRIEELLSVLIAESKDPSKELLPVARDSMKLLISSRGMTIRKKILRSLIKDKKLNTKELKKILELANKTIKPNSVIKDLQKPFAN